VFVSSAGSFYVYLYAISPVVASSLLQLANTTLSTAVAFPIQATSLSPDLVGISLSTTLTTRLHIVSYDLTSSVDHVFAYPMSASQPSKKRDGAPISTSAYVVERETLGRFFIW